MEKESLAASIRDWADIYRRARASLITRSTNAVPSIDFALALTGVRRCGKTYLAIQLSTHFSPSQVFYYNFEDPLFALSQDALQSLERLLTTAHELSEAPIEMIILDEIHNVVGWERWVRKLVDAKRYQIIVTGSSAKMLSRELATSLSGRCLEYRVFPLSYGEHLQFRGEAPQNRHDHARCLADFLKWGGFPQAVLAQTPEMRQTILRQYSSDIILKDVIVRHDIRSARALEQVNYFYQTNLASLHSYTALKKAFNIATDTAAAYTQYLSEAFLLFEVERYHANLKVQVRDPKKVYVIDTGLRSVIARSPHEDTGKLLENTVYLELLRRGQDVYYFNLDHEVDFLTIERYQPVGAIQVCAEMHDPNTARREINALTECMKALKLTSGYIVTLDHEERLDIGELRIDIVPAYRWLMQAESLS